MYPDEPWSDMSLPYTKKPVQNPVSDLFLFTTPYNRQHTYLPPVWSLEISGGMAGNSLGVVAA